MKKSKKGFTLVELIIVIAVMAILVAIAIPTIASVTKTARVNTYNTNAATIESSAKTFKSLCDSGVADDTGTTYTWSGANFATYLTNQGLDIDYDSTKEYLSTFYLDAASYNVLDVDDTDSLATSDFVLSFAADGTVTAAAATAGAVSWTSFDD